jgi:hypothetical protein
LERGLPRPPRERTGRTECPLRSQSRRGHDAPAPALGAALPAMSQIRLGKGEIQPRGARIQTTGRRTRRRNLEKRHGGGRVEGGEERDYNGHLFFGPPPPHASGDGGRRRSGEVEARGALTRSSLSRPWGALGGRGANCPATIQFMYFF